MLRMDSRQRNTDAQPVLLQAQQPEVTWLASVINGLFERHGVRLAAHGQTEVESEADMPSMQRRNRQGRLEVLRLSYGGLDAEARGAYQAEEARQASEVVQ